MKIEESLNVTFDETHPPYKTSPLVDDDLDEGEEIKITEKKNLENHIEDETFEINEVFEMNMMGELNFLGLQIKQMEDGIFFNQSKYIKEMLKKFGLEESKPMKTPISSDTKLIKDKECESVDSTKYRGMIGTDISQKDGKPIKKRQNRTRDGKVCGDEAKSNHIDFECLLEINEQIVPRFILEFYSNYRVSYTLEGQMLIEFVIQNQFFTYTIEEFGLILGIPSNGACSFTDKWSLDELQYSVPMSGPYQTNPPCLDEIKNYCPEFSNDRYFLCDRVMYPLTAQQERNTRKDYGMRRGRPSTSSSSAFGQPSSSPAIDDDNDGNNEGTCVQSLIPPLILSIRCQMTFLKSFPIHPTLT
ncbi:hypothetical protein Tco_0878167 [Tanacetum coccineum]|uniref:Retrovirus-related Pol polyprotein from transposon TNT 1-94 n=1 Tax=Tanacetum coccineum TaxID=301880 RepID=A0ABQ5BX83_9ASTR